MLASALMGFLVAFRDFLIAAALGWVGITIEVPETRMDGERACATEACQKSVD